jgi:hypothetical protein
MKTILTLISVLAQSYFCFSQSSIDSLYLGKTFPNNTPLVFIAGSSDRITISSDGKDIFYSTSSGMNYYHFSNNAWGAPKVLFNGFDKPSLSLNDSVMYVENSKPDAYYSIKSNPSWSAPFQFRSSNTAMIHHLQVTKSGTFYATTNPKLSNRGDISKILINGSDISFKSLPFPINSSLNGVDFYMDKDESYIIFPEIKNGAGDLYISYKKTDTSWTNPKSLGSLINTSDWEYAPYVSPDNKYLFFSRSSASATYWVRLGNMIDSLGHTNFSPYLLNQIKSQTDSIGHSFNFTIPDNTFIDDDGNNTLSYSATLSNNKPLPTWLSFNPDTKTFSGTLDSVGSFSIEVIAADTSKASASTIFTLKVVENPYTSISEILEQSIQIFPNPTKDKININFGSLQYKKVFVEIFDISGKQILSDTFYNPSSAKFDLTGKPKGIYILNLCVDGEKLIRKISIE